ncbi:DALR domain-containing protein, partial [Rhodoblastus sp.]|uniref:DALR domain-containing protein n=1 Tax=Rhodoblastus sp. TaxID=1962975 RepID=UPI003FD887DD
SHKHLGEVFDIHGGGIDLVFPHHENEIAQTRCAFGHNVMAKVWMHNGFLQVEGEKMSKSLGNFVTIHELLHSDKFGGKPWRGEVLRLAMLRSAYRQPIDWTAKALEEAEKTLSRWYGVLRAHGVTAASAREAPLRAAFVEALCDDLNIPRAMAELHAMAGKAEPREEDSQTAKAEAEKLLRAANLLGLLEDDPTAWAHQAPELKVETAEVEKLVAERLAARKARNFAESDRLRDVLAGMGVKLKDGKDKASGEPTTEWEVA